jgi:hypothetical protein
MARLADGDPVSQAELRLRATLRQLRLHACGSLRLNVYEGIPKKWLDLLTVAERYADGEVGIAELQAAREQRDEDEPPAIWGVDLAAAFDTDAALISRQKLYVNSTYSYVPSDRDYHLVLARYRLFEELLGPNPLPAFSSSWRTDTALSLARQMYESREFSAMPILADALQDAGCDNDDILSHCRDNNQVHVRGCWVVDLVLEK